MIENKETEMIKNIEEEIRNKVFPLIQILEFNSNNIIDELVHTSCKDYMYRCKALIKVLSEIRRLNRSIIEEEGDVNSDFKAFLFKCKIFSEALKGYLDKNEYKQGNLEYDLDEIRDLAEEDIIGFYFKYALKDVFEAMKLYLRKEIQETEENLKDRLSFLKDEDSFKISRSQVDEIYEKAKQAVRIEGIQGVFNVKLEELKKENIIRCYKRAYELLDFSEE